MAEINERGPLLSGICDVNFILRFRVAALIILLAITGFLCFQMKNMKMTKDPLESMYPSGHEFLPTLKAISDMAPLPRMLVCLVKVNVGDIYNAETVKKIDSITNGLMKIDGVLPAGITSLTKGMDDYNNTAEGMVIAPIIGKRMPVTKADFSALKRRVAVSPMGPGKYISYDGTTAMITAQLVDINQRAEETYKRLADDEKAKVPLEKHKRKEEGAFNKNLIKGLAELKAKEDDANHTLYFMGEQVITAQMTEMGEKQVGIAAGAMMLLIIVLLYLYFRTIQGVLVPFAAMVLSLVWGMGIFAWRGMEFNPMALLFPAMLGVVALAISTLAVKRDSSFSDGMGDKKQAVAAVYGNAPAAVSVLTVGLVISGMCASGVPMIKDLGYFGAFWLIGAFVAVILISPVLMSFFPLPGQTKVEPRRGLNQAVADILARPSLGSGKYIVTIAMAAVIVYGGLCAGKLEIGGNAPGTSYIRPNHPWNQAFDLFAEKFLGPYQLLVYVKAKEEGGLLDPDAMGEITDFSNFLKSDCGARECMAFDYMIQMARMTLMDGNPKWQTVPATRAKIRRMAGMVMEQGGVESFMDKTFTKATISPFFPEKGTRHIDEYAAKMQGYIDTHPSDKLDFSLGGGLLGMTKAINDGTAQAYPRIIAAALAGAVVLGAIATGSLLLGLIITLPVAFAQAVLWIIMSAAGIPVSMPAVPAAAAALGFGPVFGYVLIQRVAREYMKNSVYESVVIDGIKSAGSAIVFAGILVFAASVPWFFIGMKFQSNMVSMFGVTVFLETASSVMLIPALVNLFKPKFA